MERLYEIRDELKQLDFHSYNSLGVVEQYFRCRLWVDLSRACLFQILLFRHRRCQDEKPCSQKPAGEV